MSYRNDFDPSVYFIADSSVCGGRSVEDVVLSAVLGGATMVQLRNKVDALDIVEKQALAIKEVLADSLSDYEVPFIINDHVELAVKIGADGVHIGQGDMSPEKARALIGADMILGLTAYTRDHYDAIDNGIVDYVGTGPFYATLTKPDKSVLGAEGFAKLAKDSPVPVVAIGGITPENAAQAIKAGAAGVAMMRSISEAADPEAAARAFTCAAEQARTSK